VSETRGERERLALRSPLGQTPENPEILDVALTSVSYLEAEFGTGPVELAFVTLDSDLLQRGEGDFELHGLWRFRDQRIAWTAVSW
jgi:hypothetical protein